MSAASQRDAQGVTVGTCAPAACVSAGVQAQNTQENSLGTAGWALGPRQSQARLRVALSLVSTFLAVVSKQWWTPAGATKPWPGWAQPSASGRPHCPHQPAALGTAYLLSLQSTRSTGFTLKLSGSFTWRRERSATTRGAKPSSLTAMTQRRGTR